MTRVRVWFCKLSNEALLIDEGTDEDVDGGCIIWIWGMVRCWRIILVQRQLGNGDLGWGAGTIYLDLSLIFLLFRFNLRIRFFLH